MKKRKNKYLNLHKFVNQSDSFAEKYITNKGSRPVVIGQQNREISEFVFFLKTCSEEHKRLNILSLCLQFNTTKAELLQLNRTQFPSMGIFISKKLEIEKTKTTFIISVLKDVC